VKDIGRDTLKRRGRKILQGEITDIACLPSNECRFASLVSLETSLFHPTLLSIPHHTTISSTFRHNQIFSSPARQTPRSRFSYPCASFDSIYQFRRARLHRVWIYEMPTIMKKQGMQIHVEQRNILFSALTNRRTWRFTMSAPTAPSIRKINPKDIMNNAHSHIHKRPREI
jgi:hypothetical protein